MMQYYEKVSGKRIYLSPISLDDLSLYTKWYNDPQISLNRGIITEIYTEEMVKAKLEELRNKNCFFAVIRKEDHQLLGNVGFNKINHIHKSAECGVYIGEEENRSKGYGTEALLLLLDYGFNVLNLNNIMLEVFDFIENGIQCYKKAGFKEIGRRRQSYYYNGRYHDDVYMDITASDYRQNKKLNG